MHVYDKTTTGMHWQIQKGGGFHYHQAEQFGKDLEVAVALGTDPALLLACRCLPEGLDEVMFASLLRGERIAMVSGKRLRIQVPAHAEFVLEGVVPQKNAGKRAVRRSPRSLLTRIIPGVPSQAVHIEGIRFIRPRLLEFRRWRINFSVTQHNKYLVRWQIDAYRSAMYGHTMKPDFTISW